MFYERGIDVVIFEDKHKLFYRKDESGMKNKFKKTLSIFMAFMMLLCAVPFVAGAEEGEELSFWTDEYEVKVKNGEATIFGRKRETSGDIVIPDTIDGYPVVSIGSDAFSHYIDLTSITLPKSVTSIGEWAFYDCRSLTDIIIPEGVTSIGKNAFYACSDLKSIELPSTVVEIGKEAFRSCMSMTSFVIPKGVINIGDGSFQSCIALENITIPDSVTSIGKWAFYDCRSLTDIIIPEGVTSIGEDAFVFSGITSIVIPKGVTNISESVFAGCKSLSNVTIPSSVVSIGYDAFRECTALEKIIIPESVTSIGDEAFRKCTALKNITIPDSVTEIGASAFEGCVALTSLSLPNSMTRISNYLFRECTGLIEMVIPDYITEIGKQAFAKCSGLKSLTIPDSVKSIDELAFARCSGLSNLIIPGSMTEIGGGAFSECSGLKRVVIEEGVTAINNSAFAKCYTLSDVSIPNSMESIDIFAFLACPMLKSIIIPNSVTSIGEYAFGYYYDEENYVTAKVPDFVIHGYAGTAAETYAKENGFTFVALSDEHEHTFGEWKVTTAPTCTAEGVETRTCTECDEKETRPVEKIPHDLLHFEESSTCLVAGISYNVCSKCKGVFDYTVLPLAPHTFGEWVVTKDATPFENGEKVRTCSVCNRTETVIIDKLPAEEAKDEKTDISVIYPESSYDGNIEISVTETFDGESYHVLNTEKKNCQKVLFDIITTVGGEKVQPNGSVWVKIPLPKGYDPKNTTVYYITNNGKLEKMNSSVVGGYVIFETTHFSYYAVVEETEPSQPDNPSANCPCNCHKKGIANFFFKIILFFQRIFKQNKQCKCGIAHY